MKPKKILITGAAGYLGAKIIQVLAEQNEVIALDKHFPPNWKTTFPHIETWERDLTQKTNQENLQQHSFDAIVHTISLDHRDCEQVSIDELLAINLQITWELLEHFVKKGTKLIYLSTMQVLGKLPLSRIDENTPRNLQNRYALTHAWCEDLVHLYHKKYDGRAVTLRLSNGYGTPVFPENNCWWLVVNDLCRMAVLDQRIVLRSDGSPLRDFVHIQDVASAIEKLLQPLTSRSLYQISSGETRTMLELALIVQHTYQKLYQTQLPVYHSEKILVENIEAPITKRYQIENQRLRKMGYQPNWTLEKGIEDLLIYLTKSRLS